MSLMHDASMDGISSLMHVSMGDVLRGVPPCRGGQGIRRDTLRSVPMYRVTH